MNQRRRGTLSAARSRQSVFDLICFRSGPLRRLKDSASPICTLVIVSCSRFAQLGVLSCRFCGVTPGRAAGNGTGHRQLLTALWAP